VRNNCCKTIAYRLLSPNMWICLSQTFRIIICSYRFRVVAIILTKNNLIFCIQCLINTTTTLFQLKLIKGKVKYDEEVATANFPCNKNLRGKRPQTCKVKLQGTNVFYYAGMNNSTPQTMLIVVAKANCPGLKFFPLYK